MCYNEGLIPPDVHGAIYLSARQASTSEVAPSVAGILIIPRGGALRTEGINPSARQNVASRRF